jgi:pimeloyl-ACP methyl ester carboxylesterase
MGSFFLERDLSPALVDWILMNLRAQDGRFVWAIDRSALDVLHRTAMKEDLWDVVEGGTLPVRTIRGARSAYVSDADVRRMEAANCRVDTVPEAGHYLHVDALEAVIALLAG